jgi:hypothetical protein
MTTSVHLTQKRRGNKWKSEEDTPSITYSNRID